MSFKIAVYDHVATGFISLLGELEEEKIHIENVGLIKVAIVKPSSSDKSSESYSKAVDELLKHSFSISHVRGHIRDGMIEY